METKKRIIDAATTLFLENGVRNVSMDDIAKNLGISKRTIYEIFSDKEDLLKQVFDNINAIMYEEAISSNLKHHNVLETFLSHIYKQNIKPFYKVRFIEDIKKYYPKTYNEIQCTYDSMYSHIKNFIQLGVEQGVYRDNINIDLIAYIFIDSFYIFSRKRDLVNVNYTEHELYVTMAVNLVRGISTPKGIELIDTYIQNNFKQE